MPSISNDAIRALYEICGNDDFPVEEYCIGCNNCEHYGFPCMNCARYVFCGSLGEGCGGTTDTIDTTEAMDTAGTIDTEDITDTAGTIDTAETATEMIVDNLIRDTINNHMMETPEDEIENVRNLP